MPPRRQRAVPAAKDPPFDWDNQELFIDGVWHFASTDWLEANLGPEETWRTAQALRSLIEQGALPAAAPSTMAPAGPAIGGAEEAARLLGISEGALWKRHQRRQLPPGSVVQTGRRVQFRLDKITAPLNQRRRGAG